MATKVEERVTKAIDLGDRVKERITGFSGIVMAKSEYLNGCRRFGVQPEKVSKEGKHPDSEWFDEPALVLVKKGVHGAIPIPASAQPAAQAYRGGPARSGDRGR